MEDGTVIRIRSFADDTDFEVKLLSSQPVDKGANATVVRGEIKHASGHTVVVALKVYYEMFDKEFKEMLLRELHVVRTVQHRYILPYIGTAEHMLHAVVISPFMTNGNLRRFLECHTAVDPQPLLLQIAEAVDYLHTMADIVHGDLKCENVLISDRGEALLADFGLSTTVSKPDFSTTTVTGIRERCTFRFAAPELLLGEASGLYCSTTDIGGRWYLRSKTCATDVYAFGMLMIQAYSGQSPWPTCTHQTIIKSLHSGQSHPRPSSLFRYRRISDAWWDVCSQCICVDPLSRPSIRQIWRSLTIGVTKIIENRTLLGHTGGVLCIAYTPCGKRVVSGSYDGTIRVWDIASGLTVIGPLVNEERRDPVTVLAISPDGGRILSLNRDLTVHTWCALSGALLGSFRRHPTAHSLPLALPAVAISTDGRHILIGKRDRTVYMWSAGAGEAIAGPLRDPIRCVAFSADALHVAAGGASGTVSVWSRKLGNDYRSLMGHSQPVRALCFSTIQTSQQLASGHEDGVIKVWDFVARQLLHSLDGHTNWIRCIAFSPSAELLASASADSTIRVWDAQTGQHIAATLKAHVGQVVTLAFAPDGKSLVSGSHDMTIRAWNLSELMDSLTVFRNVDMF